MEDYHRSFAIFLDVDGVLNTRKTVVSSPDGHIGVDDTGTFNDRLANGDSETLALMKDLVDAEEKGWADYSKRYSKKNPAHYLKVIS